MPNVHTNSSRKRSFSKTFLKLHIAIVTTAVYSISMKSIFARAVIGSQGVVTDSINTTPVFSVGALVNIWKQQKESNWKKFHSNSMVTCILALILGVSSFLLFYYLTYKRTKVWENYSLLNNSFNYEARDKPNFITDIYQCSLFHLHEIHLCTCSYRIPGCCYKQH